MKAKDSKGKADINLAEALRAAKRLEEMERKARNNARDIEQVQRVNHEPDTP